MRVGMGVEQLNVYAHFVSGSLHAAFEHSSHAEFAGYRLQVFWRAFVFGCRFSRNHLQVADAGALGQDLILNAVGEVSIVWVAAQIIEGENRDAFIQSRRNCWRSFGMKALEKEACNDKQQDRDDKKIKFAPGLAPNRFTKIDIFRALNPFWRELKCPCNDQCNWKSEHEQQNH